MPVDETVEKGSPSVVTIGVAIARVLRAEIPSGVSSIVATVALGVASIGISSIGVSSIGIARLCNTEIDTLTTANRTITRIHTHRHKSTLHSLLLFSLPLFSALHCCFLKHRHGGGKKKESEPERESHILGQPRRLRGAP